MKKQIKTPKYWTAKAWAEHLKWISGFTDVKDVYVSSNNKKKVQGKANKSSKSSKSNVQAKV